MNSYCILDIYGPCRSSLSYLYIFNKWTSALARRTAHAAHRSSSHSQFRIDLGDLGRQSVLTEEVAIRKVLRFPVSTAYWSEMFIYRMKRPSYQTINFRPPGFQDMYFGKHQKACFLSPQLRLHTALVGLPKSWELSTCIPSGSHFQWVSRLSQPIV